MPTSPAARRRGPAYTPTFPTAAIAWDAERGVFIISVARAQADRLPPGAVHRPPDLPADPHAEPWARYQAFANAEPPIVDVDPPRSPVPLGLAVKRAAIVLGLA